MADRLIPGLPERVKIAILQQTDVEVDLDSDPVLLAGKGTAALQVNDEPSKKEPRTVLQQVLQSDTSRNEVTRKVKSMCFFFFFFQPLTLNEAESIGESSITGAGRP